jgi:hypothetical protein
MKATMFENFVIQNHTKIIDHYRWLINSSTSDLERERYWRCIKDHEQSLQRLIDEWQGPRVAP